MQEDLLPHGYRVREACPDDLATVLRHREHMFRDMAFPLDAAFHRATALSETFFAQGLADGSYRGWLAEDETGKVQAGGGIVLLNYHASPRDPHDRRPVIVNVYTEGEHRRRGLAKQLLGVMIDWARVHGYTSLYLHASDAGRPLYAALGFAPTAEMRLGL